MSIRSKLIASYILLIMIIISFIGSISIVSIEKYYINNITDILESQGVSFSHVFDSYIDADIYTIGQDVAKKLSNDTNAQVQVLNIKGMLLGDSAIEAKPIPVKIGTPDVVQAIGGNTGIYIEEKYGEKILHVSVPIKNKLNYVAVLRLSSSLNEVYNMLKKLVLFFLLVLIISIILALIIGFLFADRLTKPLNIVKVSTQEMAKGNFKVRAKKISNDEVGMLADSFNKMAEELGQLDEMKNEFISNISHELRTPLTSIKGFAVTAMDELNENINLYEYLSIIDSETDRLASLVDELLDFSRIELNRLKIDFQEVDIGQLIEETVIMLKPAAQRFGVNILYENPIGILIIYGDRGRLKQVLINLIDNAVKASKTGNFVRVSLDAAKDVIIRVADEGYGIAENEIGHIFDKFYRGRRSKYSGTGLGLAIVKKIIEAHGGNISVESMINKGTVFTVYLPIKKDAF